MHILQSIIQKNEKKRKKKELLVTVYIPVFKCPLAVYSGDEGLMATYLEQLPTCVQVGLSTFPPTEKTLVI